MFQKYQRLLGVITGTVGLLIAVTGAVLARIDNDN